MLPILRVSTVECADVAAETAKSDSPAGGDAERLPGNRELVYHQSTHAGDSSSVGDR